LLIGWYDEWVLPERDRVNDLRVHALEALVDRFIDCGRAREALRAARVATRVDPYRDSAHRATIRAFLAEGNPASALRHYERYRAFVRTELGIDRMTDEMMATIGALTATTASTLRAS
jgi:DNA-binding SARP family transcriptional activator